MNVVIIRRCSNCCPYCFETPDRDPAKPDMMTLEAARTLAAWASADRLESIGLIGGEPFLHPDLREIISVFREACSSARLTVFTGGVVPWQSLDDLRPDDFSLLVNVNEERDYPNSRNFKLVLEFVDHALESGFDVGLGFNVWRSDFDPRFMPELASSLGRTGFRWTVANPSVGHASATVQREDLKTLSGRCMELLREGTARHLAANLDCPLPLCFFKDDEIAWLSRHQLGVISRLGICSPPMDVTPELDAIRCFGVAACAREPISNHASPSALRAFFTQKLDLDLLARSGVFPECASCEHFNAARCQGGCFGWRSSSPADGGPLAERLYALLQAGEDHRVLEMIETESRWFLSPLSLYLGALAAKRLGDEPRCRTYALTATGRSPDPTLRQKLREVLRSHDRSP